MRLSLRAMDVKMTQNQFCEFRAVLWCFNQNPGLSKAGDQYLGVKNEVPWTMKTLPFYVIFRFLDIKYVTHPIIVKRSLTRLRYGYGWKVHETRWQHSNICHWRGPTGNHLEVSRIKGLQLWIDNFFPPPFFLHF